jgi:hypothetical protein
MYISNVVTEYLTFNCIGQTNCVADDLQNCINECPSKILILIFLNRKKVLNIFLLCCNKFYLCNIIGKIDKTLK